MAEFMTEQELRERAIRAQSSSPSPPMPPAGHRPVPRRKGLDGPITISGRPATDVPVEELEDFVSKPGCYSGKST